MNHCTILDYDEALLFAIKKHSGQKRWNGDDYITHPIRVAENFIDYELKIISILHDTLEDTNTTYKEIHNKFGKKIADAVFALSKKNGEDYFNFINRARENELAREVKIADINDNLRDLGENKQGLMEKYKKALKILRD